MADRSAPLTVLVVNYNTGAALSDCVESVLRQNGVSKVVVLDNASVDDSLDLLERRFGTSQRLDLRRQDTNLGFARGVNLVARTVDTGFLLVLNPDCELGDGALDRLVAALEQDEQAAIAGPLVRHSDGSIEAASLRRFPDPWNSLATVTGLWRLGRWLPGLKGVAERGPGTASTRVAEAVSGACMLIRSEALRSVGYFDEAYPMHCEDLDLMYRLHLAGWHCLYVPAAQARHAQGLSSRRRPVWVHWQKHVGMARYYRKFQAGERNGFMNGLVLTGIWLRCVLLLPLAWVRR